VFKGKRPDSRDELLQKLIAASDRYAVPGILDLDKLLVWRGDRIEIFSRDRDRLDVIVGTLARNSYQ